MSRPFAFDICAGCGGLSLGLKRAGFDVLGVEHMREPVILHRRYVGPCDLADVAAWHPPHDADLVIGGVPCQPFSTQGKREGLRETVGSLFPDTAEPRAQLFRHLVRIAVEAKARAVALENVRGLLSWDDGAAFAEIRAAFVDAGFVHVVSKLLDAVDFGVPQHRVRVFVIGFRSAEDAARFAWPEPTHFETGGGGRLTWRTVREALGLGTGEIHHSTGSQGQRAIDVDAPSTTIGAGDNPDLLAPVSPLDLPSPTITTSRDALGGAHSRDAIQGALGALDRPSCTITSTTHRQTRGGAERLSQRPGAALREALQVQEETIGELEAAGLLDRPGTTISAGGGGRLARPGHKVDGDQWKGCVRLTVAQCAALQDFPPGWAWPRTLDVAHRAIGNAVPAGLAAAVGRAILHALGGEDAAALQEKEDRRTHVLRSPTGDGSAPREEARPTDRVGAPQERGSLRQPDRQPRSRHPGRALEAPPAEARDLENLRGVPHGIHAAQDEESTSEDVLTPLQHRTHGKEEPSVAGSAASGVGFAACDDEGPAAAPTVEAPARPGIR